MELRERFLVVTVFLLIAAGVSEAKLRPHFYRYTCPHVEDIVFQAVLKKFQKTFVTIPATLRLFFHDCAVEGCDASVMIATPKNDAEKDAPDNESLAGDGFDTVIKSKEAVEKECPGIVSCADILTIAARDVVFFAGGPRFVVELGRRDGMTSKASRVAGKLPGPDDDIDKLMAIFRRLNLTRLDMVALSGAHSVGFAHCTRFADRLYNFSRAAPLDPSLNRAYARLLMRACPRDVGPTIAVNMDPYTPTRLDSRYYANLIDGEGLFTSDERLYADRRTRAAVERFAGNQTAFFRDFASAMVRLGRHGVKLGKEGEIRRNCTKFNWMK